MAKQVEDVVTDDRVESLKTVKFGGYDKASVDYYIDELKEKHNKEVEELKANVNKLSEAVLSLKTMREVNMTESSKTIETLKKTNSEQESEIESLKEQINAYKQRELENAGRYESISVHRQEEYYNCRARGIRDRCQGEMHKAPDRYRDTVPADV